ncbi:MAG: DUF202 domain-containing protein [Pirellulaceae bacterium]
MKEMDPVSKAYRDTDARMMILRDHLALGRTVLANERTLMAYLRTAIALAITGLLLIRFSQETGVAINWAIGWIMLGVSVVVAMFGIWRFVMVRSQLALIFKPVPESEETETSDE